MSTTLRLAIDHVVETIRAVEGVGNVYPYEVYAAQASDVRELFGYINGQEQYLRCWTVTRQSTVDARQTNVENVDDHRLVIRGYMGLAEHGASEREFQDLVELVRASTRYDYTLSNLVELAHPMQVDNIEHRAFGGILCHYVELSMVVRDRIGC